MGGGDDGDILGDLCPRVTSMSPSPIGVSVSSRVLMSPGSFHVAWMSLSPVGISTSPPVAMSPWGLRVSPPPSLSVSLLRPPLSPCHFSVSILCCCLHVPLCLGVTSGSLSPVGISMSLLASTSPPVSVSPHAYVSPRCLCFPFGVSVSPPCPPCFCPSSTSPCHLGVSTSSQHLRVPPRCPCATSVSPSTLSVSVPLHHLCSPRPG